MFGRSRRSSNRRWVRFRSGRDCGTGARDVPADREVCCFIFPARHVVGISVGIGRHRKQKLPQYQTVMPLGSYRPGAPSTFVGAGAAIRFSTGTPGSNIQTQTTQTPAGSRRDASEAWLATFRPGGRGECRVPSAPAASCAQNSSRMHTSIHSGGTGITRHSRTQWF
jgi:hypothetical protein